MAYGEFKAKRHEEQGVFEAFFRKHPFKGQFTVSGGMDEVMLFLKNYKFKPEHVNCLKKALPNIKSDDLFWSWLESLDFT